MGWVIDANKIGRYDRTYRGFRIYCTKEPDTKTEIIERDGEKWQRTDFIKGWFVAVDKSGVRLEGDSMEKIAIDIDMELLKQYYEKREGIELEWR